MRQFNRTAKFILAVAVVNIMTFAGHITLLVTGPSDGTRLNRDTGAWFENGVMVEKMGDSPDGLQTGDLVIAVGGQNIDHWLQSCPQALCPSVQRPDREIGQTVNYTVLRDGQSHSINVMLRSFPTAAVLQDAWGALVFAITNCLVFVFLLFKRPQERAIQVLVVASSGLLGSMGWAFGVQIGDIVTGTGWWIYRFATEGTYLLAWLGFLHFALVFPRPHPLIANRLRWLLFIYPVGYGIHVSYLIASRLMADNILLYMGSRADAANLVVLACLLLSSSAMLSNYVVQRDRVKQQQIRIVVISSTIVTVLAIVLWAVPAVLFEQHIFSSNLMGIIGLVIPIAIGISIQRYRLWEVDALINRTFVYFSLTIIVAGIYILVVGTLGALFQTEANLFVSLLATGLVAVSFQPLREHLQRGVNRLLYGERDDPYAVLGRLAERLEVVVASESVLPTIVETVAEALKLPYVAIALKKGESLRIEAEYARTPDHGEPADAEILPLVYQSETIGQLILARRAPDEPFSQVDRHLLETIARQAGIAAYNLRLTQDLRRSRERLVTTREEERRRLRRDLHDGLGPALASMSFKLDAVHNLADRDPDAVRKLVAELKTQMQDALADIRRIAYNLRPPALDELGLTGALKEYIAACNEAQGPQIRLEMPADLPPLPAAVEVAVYRIALEAITNVSRHARARTCCVRLSLSGDLCLEVTDDGCGIPAAVRAGVGLSSMRERAEELGGKCIIEPLPREGSRVLACLPLSLEHSTEESVWRQSES